MLSHCLVYWSRLFLLLVVVYPGSYLATPSTFACDVGTAPPIAGINPVEILTGSLDASIFNTRMVCEGGFMVCGLGIYRLVSSAMIGNVNVIRDLTLKCCSGSNTNPTSSYYTSSLVQNKTSGLPSYYDLLFPSYYQTILPLSTDITQFVFSQQGINLNNNQSVIGTFPGSSTGLAHTCPQGTALNGLYSQIISGGGNLSYFQSFLGICSVRCTGCPANFYCVGNSTATPCPLNSYSRAGSSTAGSCACGPGFTQRGGVCFCPIGTIPGPPPLGCVSCPNNSVCPGDNLAMPCPAHSLSVNNTCVCDGGYYHDHTSGGLVCSQCLAGNYCPGGSASMLPCYNNSVSQPGSALCTCNAGFYPLGVSCSMCPEGAYCIGGGVPVLCPSGSYSAMQGVSQCSLCPVNSGSSVPGGRSLRSCICAPGYTGLAAGTSSCYQCPPGEYCPGYGIETVPCGPGTYQTGYGISNQSGCSQCGPGKFSQSSGSTTSSVCIGCLVGTFQTGLGTTGCQQCLAGSYGTAPGLTVCTLCRAGTVQTSVGETTGSQCVGCMAGTYQTGEGMGSLSNCQQCPMGTFQTGIGISSLSGCILCKAGTYQSSTGKPFESSCTPCKAGKFQTVLGAKGPWACESCAAGTYQSLAGSQSNCTPCSKGTYSSGLGAQDPAVSCTSCSKGTYQPLLGATTILACVSCPIGTYQTAPGMISDQACLPCPAGAYQSMMGATTFESCMSCPTGTYQPWLAGGNITDCLPCGPGSYQTFTGASSEEACVLCPAGTYQTSPTASNSTQCISCSAGKYQTGSGATRLKDCVSCSAGTYQTATGATTGSSCILCGPGTYQSAMSANSPKNCTQCPRGSYQTGDGMVQSSTCQKCTSGSYSSGLGMGIYGPSCNLCIPGTFDSLAGVGGASSCTRCQAGKFQSDAGATNCSLCKEGTYLPLTGAAYGWWCASCEPGTYSSALGASSVNSCSPCPAGSYSDSDGPTNCSSCGYGKYSPAPKAKTCFSCMSGTYSNQTGSSVCLLCPVGQSLVDTGKSTCNQCGPGQFQFLQGSSFCFSCPLGQFQSAIGETSCTMCGLGQYQPEINQSTCLDCSSGSYASAEGASFCPLCNSGSFQPSSNSTVCFPCPLGEFQDRPGQTSCSQCSVGYYNPSPGSTACVACGAGEFQPTPGTSSCLKCQEGTYHTALGMIQPGDCLNCSEGFYSSITGATMCSPCSTGSYALVSGQTSCALCKPGTFQDSTRASECRLCTAGTFATAWGLNSRTSCTPCLRGHYSADLGVTVCRLCPAGTFASTEGVTNCSSCAAGTFMAAPGWGQEHCTPCPAGTFSSQVEAVSVATCTFCDNGYFSSKQGSISQSSCSMCGKGTVSVDNKTMCRACGSTEFCPAGYHAPIRCVPGLWCNGTYMESLPGLLTFFRGNCTGTIPCPRGTQCAVRDTIMGKGIIPVSYPNQTHFVIYEGGDNSTALSCPGQSLSYGYARIDWPYPQAHTIGAILYWLQPMACPVGTYLLVDTCTPCAAGMFSSQVSALAWDTCQACPVGTYGSTTGASACIQCPEGGYCKAIQATTWLACRPGTYQSQRGATACLSCQAGTFSSLPKASICTPCDAGKFQSSTGATRCLTCSVSQFSSSGDNICSQCGVNLASLDPGFTCIPPSLPENRDTSMWITVRGADGSDDCVSTGPKPSSSLSSPNELAVSTTVMTSLPTSCVSTLYIADRPALTRSWSNSVGGLSRPDTLTIIPFNSTFYPELCKQQGFGVLFTVADSRGNMLTDLTGAHAVLSVLDPSGQNILFSMGCSRLPQDPNTNVPIGVCRTSFCPTMRVMVKVALAWTGGSVQSQILLSPGPVGFCPPTTSWMASVELVSPSIPYLPGDTFEIQVSTLNPPATGGLVVFRFALRILGGVTLLSFQSSYSVVTETSGDVLSVVGDSSQGGGTVLGVLRFRLDAAVSGVALVVQPVPSSFQFTLANAVPYTMLVRTLGFSCRSDGYIDLLADVPRATALIANTKRKYVINWQKIQSSALDNPTAVYVVAVGNVMHTYAPVLATCASLDIRNLNIASCNVIRAGNTGNLTAVVRVKYQSITTDVVLESWVPVAATFGTVTAPGGMSGRYRVKVNLWAGPNYLIRGVDATPYLPKLLAFGVAVRGGQWRCAKTGIPFTIGVPTMYFGVCGRYQSYSQKQNPGSFFLVSGPLSGVAGLGSYTFPPSVISAAMPTGGVLLFSSSGLSLGIARVTSLSPLTHVVASQSDLVLQNTGASARCIQISIEPVVSGDWLPYTGYLPVFPAGPRSLQITLSAYVIISQQQQDIDTFIPVTTFVVRAVLLFSDGSQLPVQTDPRLNMVSSSLQVNGLAATSPANFLGNATLAFSFAGIPCVSTVLDVRVVGSSVESTTLVCPTCPQPLLLASDDDPLSQQFPAQYPSSIPATSVLVRRRLLDGRVFDKAEQLIITGDSVALVNGYIVGKKAGSASVSTQFTPDTHLVFTVVHRWAISMNLLCNSIMCSLASDLKLAPSGDGAAEPPFSYPDRLVLSLSLTLYNGSVVLYPWLQGVTPIINQIESPSPVIQGLVYGDLLVHHQADLSWDIGVHEITNGHRLHVDCLRSLFLDGPTLLYQVHCSGFWEEAHYTTTATLTDGTVKSVTAAYSSTHPLVMHHSSGLFHAEAVGQGEIVARFGGRASYIIVSAIESSRYFTSVALDSVPEQWNAPIGQVLGLTPTLGPVLIKEPWFDFSSFASSVVTWNSSDPEIIRVSDDQSGITLLSDYYKAVTLRGTLITCPGHDSPQLAASVSKDVLVNVLPVHTGDMDFGQSEGPPLPLVEIGGIMQIPVFLFVSPSTSVHLQSYMVEIDMPGSGTEPVDCSSGSLPNSQCALVEDSRVFRSVGAFSQSQLSGRILVATVQLRVTLNALATLRVHLMQAVVGGSIMEPHNVSYVIRLGSAPIPVSTVVLSGVTGTNNRRVLRGAGTERPPQVYGDTDGDGQFTSMDILFMENYIALSVYKGEQQICVVQGRCQSTIRLTVWQLLQLKPVRRPDSPATRPDGSDVLFLLRALVGKTFFLCSLKVSALPGSLSILATLRDYNQQLNPQNAMIIMELVTVANRNLAFDTKYWSNQGSSSHILSVTCRHTDDGFLVSSLPSSSPVDETSVGLKLRIQSLDSLGSDQSSVAQDRAFLFRPTGPVTTFNILGSRTALTETPTIDYLPTLNCQTLCDDGSLFLDYTLSPPQWINETALTVNFLAGTMPRFRGFWGGEFSRESPVPPLAVTDIAIPSSGTGTGVLVGDRFNVTFREDPAVVRMGLYVVQSSPPLPLHAVHWAESPVGAGGGNIFFMNPDVSPLPAQLEYVMTDEGDHVITVSLLDSFSHATDPASLTGIRLQQTWTGVSPEISRLHITPLCSLGVILWSKLISTTADETCEVLITASWDMSSQTPQQLKLTCTAYPCILQAFGQVVRPTIQTYTPTQPKISVQKPILSVGQRTQWRLECALSLPGDIPTTPLRMVTVTEHAMNAGLIRGIPVNSLVITADSIRGTMVGWASVSFGGLVRAGINVTDTINLPRTLKGLAFSSTTFSVGDGQLTAVFQGDSLVAGKRGYLLLQAVYSGGYTMLLDPTPGSDGISVRNASEDIVVSQLDGSVFVIPRAAGGSDQPIVSVEYKGLSILVYSTVIPLVPSSLVACCSVTLAGPSSKLYGHKDFASSFVLEQSKIYLEGGGHFLSLGLEDPGIQVSHDPFAMRYDRATGIWTLTPEAPAHGSYNIVIQYTHPVSLVTVQGQVTVQLVTADRMEVYSKYSSPQALLDGAEISLHRIHCSTTVFETIPITSALHLLPDTVGTGLQDISDELTLESSNPTVAVVDSTGVRGIQLGSAIITCSARGFSGLITVNVLDESVLILSISAPPSYTLTGIKSLTTFPIILNGTLENSVPLPYSSLMLVANVEINSNAFVSLQPNNHLFMTISGSTPVPMATPPTLRVSIPACLPTSVSDLTATSTLETRTIADLSLSAADVEIRFCTGQEAGDRGFNVTLVSPPPVLGFYIQLQTDGLVLRNCIPLEGMPLFSDCTLNSPVAGAVIIAGAVSSPLADTHLNLVEVQGVGSDITSIWGFIEIYNGVSATRHSIRAGTYSPVVFQSSGNTSVDRLVPGLPTVDSAVLSRSFQGLFAVPRIQTLRDTLFQLLLLVHKQRNVDTRIYSNEFELSAMFYVTDRFLKPDPNQSSVMVLFHTDQLPPTLPGSLANHEGLWVPAVNVLDGWYVVEFRQKIPQLHLAISFTVSTSTSTSPWMWHVASPVDTGLPLPSCPRTATQTATFLATYQIFLPVNLSSIPSELLNGLVDQVGCSVQVPSRRILLAKPSSSVLTLSVALESLTRVHQTNLVLMGGWLTEELERRMGSLLSPSILSNESSQGPLPAVTVERGALNFINDTRDPPTPCPAGYYFSKNGTYLTLPPHAVAGQDCYDMFCLPDYTITPLGETGLLHCIPTPVSTDIVWICVVIILTVTITLAALVCCVQLALWKSAADLPDVVFEPSEPAPIPAPIPHGPFNPHQDVPFEDSDEPELYFQNIVTNMGMDDYSSTMLMDDEMLEGNLAFMQEYPLHRAGYAQQ